MRKLLTSLALLISFIAYFILAYSIERKDFYTLITAYGLAFLAYAYLIFNYHHSIKNIEEYYHFPIEKLFSLRNLLIISIFFRVIFIVSTPVLSDDYFRFFLDGKLLAQGFNPYLHLPSELIQSHEARELGLTKALFQSLNSPNYYTVYPPFNQICFWLGSFLFPNNIWGAVVVMRLEIILAEGGSLYVLWYFLPKLKLLKSAALIYAFNPLVIVELSGNLHFEGVVLYLLLLAVYYLFQVYQTSRYTVAYAGFYYALAIATKLVPLILLPVFLRKLGLKIAVIFYGAIGIILVLIFLPFVSWDLAENMLSSVNLYFKSFEFNASIYYLVRWWGFQEYGYNIIASAGQNLSKIALLIILVLSFTVGPQASWKALLGRMLFILSTYYFFTTTVHPWYICNLVFLSVFSRYRFAVVWSGLAVLSYTAYQTDSYVENLYLVALEYLVVYGVLVWEVLGIKAMKVIK